MHEAQVLSEVGPWLRELETASGVPRSALAAMLVLVLGWIVAQVASRVTRKVFVKLERWLPTDDHGDADRAGRHRAANVIARSVFWIVFLVFVMTSTELLGLPVVTAWLSGLTNYLPRVLFAFVIAVLGIVGGHIARRMVSRAASTAGLDYAGRAGRVAQTAVVLATLLVAVEQLGIEVRFVTTALMIAFTSLLGAAALAFGIGGHAVVTNILAGHYARKLYDVGQVIRIRGVQGRILRMTSTAIVLESEDGEVAVPSRDLLTTRSTLVARGS